MKISILGTGAMGTAMGEAIINAGHELIVYNRTIDKTKILAGKGAKVVLTPTEAIKEADISIIVMIDGKAVKNTIDDKNVLSVIKDKKIINASTSNVEDALQINEIIEKNGGQFVELSMQAVPDTLRTGSATFKIGCKSEEEAYWIETLSSFSGEVVRVGEIGDVSKIEFMNLLGGTFSIIKAAYIVAIAEKYKILPEVYTPMITMADSMSDYYLNNMIAHNYDNNTFGNVKGHIELINSIINGVSAQGISTKIFEDFLDLYKKAMEMGYSEKDGSSILEVILN